VCVVIDVVSVMAAYAPITLTTSICCHNTVNINNNMHIGTRYVILAKPWMRLPDDGFYVNRNMLEQLL
jgi:hypothetical protein